MWTASRLMEGKRSAGYIDSQGQHDSQSFAAYKLGVSSIVPNGLLSHVSQWYISMYVSMSEYIRAVHTTDRKKTDDSAVA